MKLKSLVRSLAAVVLFSAGFAGIVYAAGSAAIARAPQMELPLPPDFPVERIVLNAEGKPDLAGWMAGGNGRCGPVLLLHGRGSDKSHMVGRAGMLHQAGFPVLLFDLPAHGESGGDVRGFGLEEADAVARMASFIESRFKDQKTGAIGASLGAAGIVLAQDRFKADAYVLEELFTTLQETTAKRMRLPVGKDIQARVMLAQLPYRLGFSADDVRPVDAIGKIESPVMLLAGSEDPFAGPADARRLYEAVTTEKELVMFEGARHQNLYRFDPATYEANVLPFLTKTLCTR